MRRLRGFIGKHSEKINLEAERARHSFAEFVKQAWHVLEPGNVLIWNWHIDIICSHLEAVSRGEVSRLLINVPPGHMKSLLVSVLWPAWVWIHKSTWRVLFSSYDMALSTRDSIRCRDLITSEWYQKSFRPRWKLKGDLNTKTWYENTDGGLRQALSVGGKGTGFRGNAVVVDDPHNVKEHPSDVELMGVHFWWDKRMSSRLNRPAVDAKIIIQQRVHENDLSGYVLKQTKKPYTHVNLPSEFDPDKKFKTKWGEDPRTEPGELLFEEFFTPDVIEELKEMLGEYDFAGQHNQNPTPPGGGIIKQHWFRFWYPEGLEERPSKYVTKLKDGELFYHEQVELPERFENVFQSWDMTFKGDRQQKAGKKSKVDFVVGQVWSQIKKKRFLLDQVRERYTFTETVDAVKRMSKLFPEADLKYVEDAANGPAIESELHEEVGGIELVKPIGDKHERAHSASHPIRAGYVYLPHPDIYPWVKEYLHEICTFDRAPNDDQLDATTQAINESRESQSTFLERITVQ